MTHLNLEEVLGRTIDLLEGLGAGLWNGLHDAGGEKNKADASLRTTRRRSGVSVTTTDYR